MPHRSAHPDGDPEGSPYAWGGPVNGRFDCSGLMPEMESGFTDCHGRQWVCSPGCGMRLQHAAVQPSPRSKPHTPRSKPRTRVSTWVVLLASAATSAVLLGVSVWAVLQVVASR